MSQAHHYRALNCERVTGLRRLWPLARQEMLALFRTKWGGRALLHLSVAFTWSLGAAADPVLSRRLWSSGGERSHDEQHATVDGSDEP